MDLIDRQAAIEAINAIFPVDPDKSEYAQGIACGAALALTYIKQLPAAEPHWIPVSETPDDNREVEVTCEVRRLDGKKYRYTCHASYVHRYSIESTDYCNWEECDEYNEEEDKYYALSGWYERVHNWDDYSYCAIEDFVVAWRELPEPYKEEQK